jgi:cobalt-zinc-cadmium efflux system protein
MSHNHDPSHQHNYKSLTLKRLLWSLSITAVVMVVEVVGGWISGSIALISDAGHMLTHVVAIGISVSGILIARRPACHHRTFGLLRAEVVAAFVNALFLLGVTVWIVVESIDRIANPREILTTHMFLVACLGLTVNVISLFLLQGIRRGDMNVHSVFLHMISDAASSVAIVIAALVIHYTRWTWLDPAVSISIALLIVLWAGGLLRDSLRVLLEMAPKGHNVEDITQAMRRQFPQILETDQEHVWTITPEITVFTAHLTVDVSLVVCAEIDQWLEQIGHWLEETFDVSESTLQVRFVDSAAEDPPPSGGSNLEETI